MTPDWLRELTVRNLLVVLAVLLVLAVAMANSSEPPTAAQDGAKDSPATGSGPGRPAQDKVVTRTASVRFPDDGESTGPYRSAFVSCRVGERVVGGGLAPSENVSRESRRNVIVVRSRPGGVSGAAVPSGEIPRSWYVQARRDVATVATTVTVKVLCAS